MSTRAVHPVAQGLLGWMQANPQRLRALLDEEAGGAEDLGPAGDPAVRAHLRFVAEGLAAVAAPGGRDSLEAFAAGLPGLLAEREDRVDDEMRRVGEAHAFEVGLQFGGEAAEDPSVHAMVDRRVRIAAWTRVFLEGLDAARAPAAPVAPAALEWMGARQTLLADTIFAMDRRAKEREIARGGPDAVANPEVVNRIGQAAMVQAHARFLVEALAETL
jgi:hypothetical protein